MNKTDVYIFDLDDTLYQNTSGSLNMHFVDRKILEQLQGTKIIFSNATYGYCMMWLNILGIRDLITAVFSCDLLGGYKPNINIYTKLMVACNINCDTHNIYFFDNLAINLIPAHELGWHAIHIQPNIEGIIKPKFTRFDDINTALICYTIDKITKIDMNQ